MQAISAPLFFYSEPLPGESGRPFPRFNSVSGVRNYSFPSGVGSAVVIQLKFVKQLRPLFYLISFIRPQDVTHGLNEQINLLFRYSTGFTSLMFSC